MFLDSFSAFVTKTEGNIFLSAIHALNGSDLIFTFPVLPHEREPSFIHFGLEIWGANLVYIKGQKFFSPPS